MSPAEVLRLVHKLEVLRDAGELWDKHGAHTAQYHGCSPGSRCYIANFIGAQGLKLGA